MKKIGLTGGIGSGKSTVAQILQDNNVPVFDLDDIGRELFQFDQGLQEQIFAIAKLPKGADKALLRERLFRSPEIRKAVEKYLHPLIFQEFERRAEEIREKASVVVCEAALLVETGHFEKLDGLILVTASEPVRMKRLLTREGMTPELIQLIFKSQLNDHHKVKHADHIIYNDGEFDHLQKQVLDVLKRI